MQFKGDKEFFQAALNLQGNEDFMKLIIGIKAYHQNCGLHFPRLSGDQLVQLQGRAALALELIVASDAKWARAELERILKAESLAKNPAKMPY